MSKTKMELKLYRTLSEQVSVNFLRPEASLEMALADRERFEARESKTLLSEPWEHAFQPL